MSKTLINFFLDVLLLLITLGLVFASCILHLVFPSATSSQGWRLWGLDYDQWAMIQFTLLAVIVLAILLHVMMHWTWVCAVIATRFFKKRLDPQDSTQTLYGVGTLILILVLLGCLLITAQMTIQKPSRVAPRPLSAAKCQQTMS